MHDPETSSGERRTRMLETDDARTDGAAADR